MKSINLERWVLEKLNEYCDGINNINIYWTVGKNLHLYDTLFSVSGLNHKFFGTNKELERFKETIKKHNGYMTCTTRVMPEGCCRLSVNNDGSLSNKWTEEDEKDPLGDRHWVLYHNQQDWFIPPIVLGYVVTTVDDDRTDEERLLSGEIMRLLTKTFNLIINELNAELRTMQANGVYIINDATPYKGLL